MRLRLLVPLLVAVAGCSSASTSTSPAALSPAPAPTATASPSPVPLPSFTATPLFHQNGLTWRWGSATAGSAADASGDISFPPPGPGCWPASSCGPASATLIFSQADGSVLPISSYTATMTANCASSSPISNGGFVVTQGNSGYCALVAGDGAGHYASLMVQPGAPPRTFLVVSIVPQPPIDQPTGAMLLARGQSVTITPSETLAGTPVPIQYGATVFGSCVTAQPATGSTFTVTGSAGGGLCIVSIGDNATQSYAYRFFVP